MCTYTVYIYTYTTILFPTYDVDPLTRGYLKPPKKWLHPHDMVLGGFGHFCRQMIQTWKSAAIATNGDMSDD